MKNIICLLVAFFGLSAQAASSYSSLKIQYLKTKNVRFAYRKYGRSGGTPLVLLMHTRGNMDGWDPELLDILAEKRPVIAFDNRGVGLTDGTTPNDFASMADDAAEFIEALGYKKVDLLGFSIGGAVAQELLIRHNNLIRRVILTSTSAKGGIGVNDISEKSKAVSTKETMTDEDLLYAFFAPSLNSQSLGKAYLKRIKLGTAGHDAVVSLAAAKAQAIARNEWGKTQTKPDERLKSVTNPVLIANGKDDIRMPTINSYNLFGILPKAQLQLYPDSAHGFLFQYPKLCGANFTEFLDQTEISEEILN